jgi:hypothetical protein
MPVTRSSRCADESRLNFEFANNSSSELSRDSCPSQIPEAINFSRPACARQFRARAHRTQILHRIFRKNGEKTNENSQPGSLAFFVAFAAELLELGEHSTDVHLARLFISFRSRSHFGLLARRGFGGR